MIRTKRTPHPLTLAGRITVGSKPGFDETKQLSGESCKQPWPPRIKFNEAERAQPEEPVNVRR